MYLKVFPYNQLKLIKQLLLTDGFDKDFRAVSVEDLEEVAFEKLKDPFVFVAYGQSNSANSGQLGYKNGENVYMFMNGKIYGSYSSHGIFL